MAVCNDQGEGTDPEALDLSFHHQGHSFLSAYCQVVTNLVDGNSGGICLGQWGLCSLSALSSLLG